MYKFTNGHIVYDKKIADNYIKAGYKLIATGGIVKSNKLFDEEQIISVDINRENGEIIEENNSDKQFVSKVNKQSKNTVKRAKKSI